MKSGKVFLIIGIVLVSLFAIGGCSYNKMVSMEESIDAQWAQVQNQYQRRYDLIPNLVNTVKGYASHESEVFEQVTEARSKVGGVINIDSSVLDDPEAFDKYQKIQSELGTSLQRLMAVTESYPELKANQNFLALQDELEGTENRIATERMRFNETVQSYNKYIRGFPRNMFAGMFGFEKKSYFAAGTEAQNAPKVEF
ncbi:LemA family protein [Treponema sp.]|uniref:LemA family protein n=1 Tax=Treponema sp. TaxID=166 RepID=UPI00298E0EA0|nr:LemA family protein [Treponema sp.]